MKNKEQYEELDIIIAEQKINNGKTKGRPKLLIKIDDKYYSVKELAVMHGNHLTEALLSQRILRLRRKHGKFHTLKEVLLSKRYGLGVEQKVEAPLPFTIVPEYKGYNMDSISNSCRELIDTFKLMKGS